jgi:hypothetical protein
MKNILKKIDFKKILMHTGGEAAGLLAVTGLNKINKVATAKPIIKGLIYKAVGVVGTQILSGGKVKKGNELIEGAERALSVAGTSQIINAIKPGLVPAVGGYEDYPINGVGYEVEETVDGFDDDDPNAMSGYEEDVMQ